jgi:hypothetical protein
MTWGRKEHGAVECGGGVVKLMDVGVDGAEGVGKKRRGQSVGLTSSSICGLSKTSLPVQLCGF